MPFADLHCDTIAWMHHCRQAGEAMSLRDTYRMHINLQKMHASGYLLQNFALFLNLAQTTKPWQDLLTLAQLYASELKKNSDLVRPVSSFADILLAREEGKVAAVLTAEEGGVCQGDLTRLSTLHQLGVRMLTLTWNHENELGYPNGMTGGLKPFGYEFLAEMERLGITADVSHLNEQGFWDVVRAAKKPFVASHSSARALRNHRRNLTDEQIKAVAAQGGIIGVNFYADFLGESKTTRTADIVRHIRHIRNVGGLDVVALGSDFDGITCPLEMVDAAGMAQLTQALEQDGFPQAEIDAICWGNVLRFYETAL